MDVNDFDFQQYPYLYERCRQVLNITRAIVLIVAITLLLDPLHFDFLEYMVPIQPLIKYLHHIVRKGCGHNEYGVALATGINHIMNAECYLICVFFFSEVWMITDTTTMTSIWISIQMQVWYILRKRLESHGITLSTASISFALLISGIALAWPLLPPSKRKSYRVDQIIKILYSSVVAHFTYFTVSINGRSPPIYTWAFLIGCAIWDYYNIIICNVKYDSKGRINGCIATLSNRMRHFRYAFTPKKKHLSYRTENEPMEAEDENTLPNILWLTGADMAAIEAEKLADWRCYRLGIVDLYLYPVAMVNAYSFNDYNVMVYCFFAMIIGFWITTLLAHILDRGLPALPIPIGMAVLFCYLTYYCLCPFLCFVRHNKILL